MPGQAVRRIDAFNIEFIMELFTQLLLTIVITITAALSAGPLQHLEAPVGENRITVGGEEQMVELGEILDTIGIDEVRYVLESTPSPDNIRRTVVFALSFGAGLALTFLLQRASLIAKRRRKGNDEEVPDYTGWDALYLPVFLALLGGVFLQSTLVIYEMAIAGTFFFLAMAVILAGVVEYFKGSRLLFAIFLGWMVLPTTAAFYVGDMVAVGDTVAFATMDEELIAFFSVSLVVAVTMGVSYLLFIKIIRHLLSGLVDEEAMTIDDSQRLDRGYDSDGNRRQDGSSFGDFL